MRAEGGMHILLCMLVKWLRVRFVALFRRGMSLGIKIAEYNMADDSSVVGVAC